MAFPTLLVFPIIFQCTISAIAAPISTRVLYRPPTGSPTVMPTNPLDSTTLTVTTAPSIVSAAEMDTDDRCGWITTDTLNTLLPNDTECECPSSDCQWSEVRLLAKHSGTQLFAGFVSSGSECITLVASSCPWANIAKIGTVGDCWCQRGVASVKYRDDGIFYSCRFRPDDMGGVEEGPYYQCTRWTNHSLRLQQRVICIVCCRCGIERFSSSAPNEFTVFGRESILNLNRICSEMV